MNALIIIGCLFLVGAAGLALYRRATLGKGCNQPPLFDFDQDIPSNTIRVERIGKENETFRKYLRTLSDADLRAIKGLSAPLMKARKTEMDRRSRRARKAKEPGWDANGSPCE